jgi:uncharacterized protein YjbI with pentapeptide repeats
VLRLIEAHPEGRLVLPHRNPTVADLRGVDLSRDTLRAKVTALENKRVPWWDPTFQGAYLEYADLQGAKLTNANLQGGLIAERSPPRR